MRLLTNTGTFLSPHEAILQNLDWWQHRGNTHHFYPKGEFESKLPSFDALPIIFSNKDHPKDGVRGRDIESVLKEIDGKLVGYTRQPLINNMGSPKLVSTLDITDPEIEGLIQKGDIYLSTGLWYDGPDVGRIANVEGDHVLLFQRSKGGTRGDPGALILNASFDNDFFEDSTMTGEKTDPKNAEDGGTGMTAAYERLLKTNQDEIIGQKVTIEKQAGEIEDLKKLITNKDEIISALEKELEGVKADKKKTDQSLMLNACFLPGTIDHFQERINSGELEDPVKSLALMAEMGTYNGSIKTPDLKDPEGNKFIANRGGKQQEQDNSDAETIALMAEMKAITGR